MDKFQEYLDLALDWSIIFVPKLLAAVAIFFIGFWVIKKVMILIKQGLEKANVGPEITTFLASILDITLKFIVILTAAGMIGFEVSSLLGILAAAAFAIGLALQGFMGNFASGITIVFFKPYKIGDWVDIADKFGKVENIQIFNTTLTTPGKKTIIIPNGKVTDDAIVNYSTNGTVKLELQARMPYEEDYPKVARLIINALKEMPMVMKDPAPSVGIEAFDTHDIILSVQPYIDPENYWAVTYEVHQKIKSLFSENGIKMAYSEGVDLGKIGK